MAAEKKKPRQKRVAEPSAPYRVARKRETNAVSAPPRRKQDRQEWNRAEWEWVRRNRRRLQDEYAGKWIAVANQEVVGSGKLLSTALRQARARGFNHPFVEAYRRKELRGLPEVAQWL